MTVLGKVGAISLSAGYTIVFKVTSDAVVKTLYLLRHYEYIGTAAYLSMSHSSKFMFLVYGVFRSLRLSTEPAGFCVFMDLL